MRTQFSINRRIPRDLFTRLWRDTSGISLIYVTVALPALVGVCLLAVDAGRLFSLHSSLQSAADSIALAAAGELDRAPDSIVRANNAVRELVSNPAIFATDVARIDGSNVSARYLKSLPASDASPIAAANIATDPVEARYVEITVAPVTFTTLFPATFIGAATNTARPSASAVAGFEAVVCDFTPMFMCNPYEPVAGVTDPLPDYGLYSHVADTTSRRRLISFKRHQRGEPWRPADYGFLAANPGGGDEREELGRALASVTPKYCFALNRLFTTRSRDIGDIKNAFNVRFDLYDSDRYGPSQYPPGVNVRKGYIVKKVGSSDPPEPCRDNKPISAFEGELTPHYPPYDGIMGLPRDSCFDNGSCTLAGGRMGNGDWGGDTGHVLNKPDFEQYWSTNFGSASRPSGPGGTYSNSNLPSRYVVYREEIEQRLQTKESFGVEISNVTYREKGSPVCGVNAEVGEPDRRIVYGALINCRAVGMSGRFGGPYQGVAFGKFFMTEPMSDDGTLWAELVDIVKPGNSNQARDMVQLYR